MQPVTIYRRVSTTEQAAEGVSLEAQEAKARAWAAANDHTVQNVHCDALTHLRQFKFSSCC